MNADSSVPDRRHVLLVDDDPAILDTLLSAFELAGLKVDASRTFEEARARLLTERFDVLMTDVRLGAFNGIQLAVIARDRDPHIAIIVFSGFDDPVLRVEAERVGARYLVKPVTAAQLMELVSAL
jgi:DNA-binding response OmpR family regulator